jgi:hypothetical protein
MFCFGMIILLFVTRTIKIITTKKVEGTEDVLCALFWFVFLLPFAIAYFFIKSKLKKEPEKELKEDDNGIKNLFKM